MQRAIFMEFTSEVKLDLKGLESFGTAVNAQLNGQPGPVQSAIKLWAVRYRSFAQIRFDLYSRGGGDWKQLAASTIKQRRRGTKSNTLKLRAIYAQKQKADPASVSMGGVISILRDTGLLFNALNPVFNGAPGAIEDQIPFGVRVGYGGPQRHDNDKYATIADIASYHQEGNLPRMPSRKIIVDPPEDLLHVMAEDMQKAMVEVAKS